MAHEILNTCATHHRIDSHLIMITNICVRNAVMKTTFINPFSEIVAGEQTQLTEQSIPCPALGS